MWVWNHFRIMVASNCLRRKWRDYVIYIYALNICLILRDFHPSGIRNFPSDLPPCLIHNTVFTNSRPAWWELSAVYLEILKKNSGGGLCLVDDLCVCWIRVSVWDYIGWLCMSMYRECVHGPWRGQRSVSRIFLTGCPLRCFWDRVSHWTWSSSIWLNWMAIDPQRSSSSFFLLLNLLLLFASLLIRPHLLGLQVCAVAQTWMLEIWTNVLMPAEQTRSPGTFTDFWWCNYNSFSGSLWQQAPVTSCSSTCPTDGMVESLERGLAVKFERSEFKAWPLFYLSFP